MPQGLKRPAAPVLFIVMTKKHPGFKAVSGKIAKEYEAKGMSDKKAKEVGAAIAANAARNASLKAKKANPALKKVKGK